MNKSKSPKTITFQDAEKFAKTNPELKHLTAQKVLDNSDGILRKFEAVAQLTLFIANIKPMLSMIKAYCHKKYTKVPKKTIASICFALFYTFMPVDAIPDTLPVVGYVDDIAVVQHVLKSANDDIDDYKKWEEQAKSA